MFGFAKFIVNHKIAAVAVIAAGVFFMTPGKDEQAANEHNPWASPPAGAHVAASAEPGILDTVIDKADTMLAESGYDPRDQAETAVGRFDDTATKYSEANSR